MARFLAVYEANIEAPNLRVAKNMLRETFECGVSPKEVCEEMIQGLKRVPDPCEHKYVACTACGEQPQ